MTDGFFKLIFPHKHRIYEQLLSGNDGTSGKVNEFYPLNEKWLIELRRDPGEMIDWILVLDDASKNILHWEKSKYKVWLWTSL